MKTLVILLIPVLLFCMTVQQKAKKQHDEIIMLLQTAESSNKICEKRGHAFQKLLTWYPNSDNEYLTIKDGFFKILTKDPEFFINQMILQPNNFTVWKNSFSLNWMGESRSPYPEMKAEAIAKLKKQIREQEKLLQMQKEILELLKKTKTTVLH